MELSFEIMDSVSRAPIPDVVIRFTAPVDRVETTNRLGRATLILLGSGWHYYTLSKGGYKTHSAAIDIVQGANLFQTRFLTPEPAPAPPVYEPPGGLKYCTLVEYPSQFGTLYGYDLPGGGVGGRGHFSRADAVYSGSNDPRCAVPAPPPSPVPISADIVQKHVDILQDTVRDITAQIRDISTRLSEMGQALVDIEARLRAWIIDSILDLIWTALTRQKRVG